LRSAHNPASDGGTEVEAGCFERVVPPVPDKQKRRSMSGVFLQLVPAAGIELATFALRMRCSTN
jgi:hypothetical protein